METINQLFSILADTLGMSLATLAVTVVFLTLFCLWKFTPLSLWVEHVLGQNAMLKTALMPYARAAVVKAYDISEMKMKETQTKLNGVDKKRIAMQLIEAIPGDTDGIPTRIVLAFISQDNIEALIQSAFDEMHNQIDVSQEYIADQINPG